MSKLKSADVAESHLYRVILPLKYELKMPMSVRLNPNRSRTSHLEPVPPPSYFGHSQHIPFVCLLAVVVLLLGPLLGPKLLLLSTVCSLFSLTLLSS